MSNKPPIPESEVRAFGKDNIRFMMSNYFDRYSLDFIREFRKILDWYVIKRDFDLPKKLNMNLETTWSDFSFHLCYILINNK